MTQTPLKIDHIKLLVGSLAASQAYYSSLLPLLGFTEEREAIWTDGAGFYLQFMEAEAGSRPYDRYGAGMNHLGFSAPSPDIVEDVSSAMKAAGFQVPEIIRLGGAAGLFMVDPDGIRFEVTYYPPGMSVVS